MNHAMPDSSAAASDINSRIQKLMTPASSGISRGLRHLIGEILKHEQHERSVLLDSTNVDCGGEG